MRCDFIYFSEHALKRMAERGIRSGEVESAVQKGEIIKNYPNDEPAPSQLILGFVGKKPIHVLVSRDVVTDFCFVITTYFPESDQWEPDFKIKKLKP